MQERYAIPDACIDIQFIYEKGRYVPYACGTHTKVSPAYISGSKKTFAVKFEPGVIPDFMKEYISDIVCDRKCLAYIDDIQNISSMKMILKKWWIFLWIISGMTGILQIRKILLQA